MSEHETLRDTFAAAAMTGIIASSDDSQIKKPQAEFLARQAWLVADAMLRQRARTTSAEVSSTLRNGAVSSRETVPQAATTNMVDAAAVDAAPSPNSVAAQTTTCDVARQPFDSASTTDHDAASAATAAELARSPGQSPRGTGGTTWQPMCWCCSGPGIQSFHESKAEAEEYREHSGIADEVEVFQVGRAFTLTDAEREAVWSAIEHGEDATVSGLPPLWTSALRQLLARLGGER